MGTVKFSIGRIFCLSFLIPIIAFSSQVCRPEQWLMFKEVQHVLVNNLAHFLFLMVLL